MRPQRNRLIKRFLRKNIVLHAYDTTTEDTM